MDRDLRAFVEASIKAINNMLDDEPYHVEILDNADGHEVHMDNDFEVGDAVKIVNYKQTQDGDEDIEMLEGVVVELNCEDDEGVFNRVKCGDRKFRTHVKNGRTRLGTKCTKI